MKKDLSFREIDRIIEEIVENYIWELGDCEDYECGRLIFDSGIIEKNFKDKNELIDDLIIYLKSNKE